MRGYSFTEQLDVLGDICGPAPRAVHVTDEMVPWREYFPFRRADLVLDVDKLGNLVDVPLRSDLATTFEWFQRAGVIVDGPAERENAWRARFP